MGLVSNGFGDLLSRAIRVTASGVELLYEIADRPFRAPLTTEGELMDTEGPDDLWPAEPVVQDAGVPELQVTVQWGLCLPNGEVHWNAWQGISFTNAIERTKMVATLQQTAIDIGLASGEQTDQFLARYQWATREQRATVFYEDTGVYPLTDPYVSALDASKSGGLTPHGHDLLSPPAPSLNGAHPDLGLCPGSVGGDAQ